MMNWKKERKIAMNATAQQLIDSDTGENEYGYHISVIDGINIAWRYHKQTASNAYDVCYGNKAYSATHIIIEEIPNFDAYNSCKSTAEFENRIIAI